ncbi:TPA: crossover junction endodeoxyribonuclease RuvC [Candidatus Poribacteria bacterium]|nr:crossover junction endodeoxyribonuclease RuvC [Candidatus Poribacteria bacterium]
MTALGINASIANTGYGIVTEEGSTLIKRDFGVIRTAPDIPIHLRLKKMYDAVIEVIHEYRPEVVVLKELSPNRKFSNVLTVGQVQGVVMLAAANADLDVRSYTPSQVKQSIVGSSKSSGHQVQQMVKVLLGLKETPKPDQLAICHLRSYKMQNLYQRLAFERSERIRR